MAEEKSCDKPEEHHLHLCELKISAPHAEVAKLCKNPKYVCANCGGRTNRGRNLCRPNALKAETLEEVSRVGL